METKFVFKGMPITLGTVGMMKLAAKVSGKTATNPLEGITDVGEMATFIMYGALAYEDYEANRAIEKSVEEVSSIVDTWSLSECMSLIRKYLKVVSEGAETDEEEGFSEPQKEEKEPKKRSPLRK